jgi:hypothetical protein
MMEKPALLMIRALMYAPAVPAMKISVPVTGRRPGRAAPRIFPVKGPMAVLKAMIPVRVPWKMNRFVIMPRIAALTERRMNQYVTRKSSHGGRNQFDPVKMVQQNHDSSAGENQR